MDILKQRRVVMSGLFGLVLMCVWFFFKLYATRNITGYFSFDFLARTVTNPLEYFIGSNGFFQWLDLGVIVGIALMCYKISDEKQALKAMGFSMIIILIVSRIYFFQVFIVWTMAFACLMAGMLNFKIGIGITIGAILGHGIYYSMVPELLTILPIGTVFSALGVGVEKFIESVIIPAVQRFDEYRFARKKAAH